MRAQQGKCEENEGTAGKVRKKKKGTAGLAQQACCASVRITPYPAAPLFFFAQQMCTKKFFLFRAQQG